MKSVIVDLKRLQEQESFLSLLEIEDVSWVNSNHIETTFFFKDTEETALGLILILNLRESIRLVALGVGLVFLVFLVCLFLIMEAV